MLEMCRFQLKGYLMQDQSGAMLRVGQFSVGSVATTSGLTLVLPRTKYEYTILVAGGAGERMAVLLEGNDPFVAFSAENNCRFAGILIPEVDIEMDLQSAYEVRQFDIRPGTMVRSGSTLSIATSPPGSRGWGVAATTLISGLPELPENQSVGFLSWRIVLGSGVDRQILKTFTAPGGDGS